MVVQPPVHDLVVVALPGVQRLIGESQSTADVRAGSEIVAHLAGVATRHIGELGGELIIPSALDELEGIPNRIVVLAPSGSGVPIVEKAVAAVRDEWSALLQEVFKEPVPVANPGMPNVQWVCVPDDGRGYGWQWARAQALLVDAAARRRVA